MAGQRARPLRGNPTSQLDKFTISAIHICTTTQQQQRYQWPLQLRPRLSGSAHRQCPVTPIHFQPHQADHRHAQHSMPIQFPFPWCSPAVGCLPYRTTTQLGWHYNGAGGCYNGVSNTCQTADDSSITSYRTKRAQRNTRPQRHLQQQTTTSPTTWRGPLDQCHAFQGLETRTSQSYNLLSFPSTLNEHLATKVEFPWVLLWYPAKRAKSRRLPTSRSTALPEQSS